MRTLKPFRATYDAGQSGLAPSVVRPRTGFRPWPIGLFLLVLPLWAGPGLRLGMRAAWDEYVEAVDTNLINSAGDAEFLRISKEPYQIQDEVRRGGVFVTQVVPSEASPLLSGSIHHWVGTVFIPGATLADVMAVERDYDRYPEWFAPTITHAGLIARAGDRDQVAIRYVNTTFFLTTVLEAEYDTQYVRCDPRRWYSISKSTRVQEFHNYGKPEERKMAVDDPSAYLWRIHGISRYEQKDNGVYIEQENIALGRRIPASLRWIVEPAVRHLAKDLMRKSLEQTRAAILAKSRE